MARLPFLISVPDDAPPHYREFWRRWQVGDSFGAHEVLEELWRETRDERKLFYNGLIHAAVALYQHERGNAVGAARQNVRMQEKLAPYEPQFYGVDVDELIRSIGTEIAPSLTLLNDVQRAQLESLRAALKEKLSRK
jgi:predicted metal-dependent hydrolase